MKERIYLLYDFEPWKIFLHLPVFIIAFFLLFPTSQILKDITSSTKTILIVVLCAFFLFIIYALNTLLFKIFTSNKLTIKTNNEYLDICIRKKGKEEIKLMISIDSIKKIETKYFARDTHFKIYYNLDQVFTITRNDWFLFIKDDFNLFTTDIKEEISVRGLPIIK
jgi:hypothetical protein